MFNILYVGVILFERCNSFNMVIIWECIQHSLTCSQVEFTLSFFERKKSCTKSFVYFLNIFLYFQTFIYFLIKFIYASVIFLLYRTIIKHPGPKRCPYLKFDNGIKREASNKILPIFEMSICYLWQVTIYGYT